MKKVLQLLLVPVLGVSVALMGAGSVSAQSAPTSCGDVTISNTGADSVNSVVCENDTTIVIKCKNDTEIRIDVDQDADSGNAENEGNTNGGDSTSGNAGNTSDLNVNAENECLGAEEEEENPPSNNPVKPSTTTPTQPTPTQPQTKVAALPKTGELSPVVIASAALAGLVAIAVATKLGVHYFASVRK